ncbi:NTP transferase domain-containing protein [Maribacter hydrothermalis]|uniref:Probable molybdenum cofactor guanylyltransferase n=1 Tax=Maribacter hydrothermalis TaxID=1836467 RepID=A0A1B7ZDE3_9FLAO|nr:NTP transferase domain-containing protein [Maribacter hydrothermalis]APQ18427.1 molybdenum cofactor guanylyltransferase [Maribacter hydrothermalis]OBR41366.1 molybdenum cofactor guanylyltransferase [Maribacter hydrothermalis]
MIFKDKLYGLVLSGGKSTRMGKDKGLITYHKLPQREHLYQLLNEVCDRTFLSIRKDQVQEISNDFETIVDTDEFRGPYNGLLSAHKVHPEAAWLVLACDLPLMDKKALQELVAARNSNKIASAFADAENPLPEPLCAIWEPDALKQSAAYLEAGNGSCPRKFLINADVNLVFPERKEVLLNANSKVEYEEALLKIAP